MHVDGKTCLALCKDSGSHDALLSLGPGIADADLTDDPGTNARCAKTTLSVADHVRGEHINRAVTDQVPGESLDIITSTCNDVDAGLLGDPFEAERVGRHAAD